MKNIIKFFTLFFILSILAYSMSGCATAKIAITPNASGIDKSVQVSDEDFDYWKKTAQDGKDSIERSRGTFWSGQYYYNKKNYSDAIKYFEFNEKYYSDTDMGYLSVVRLFDINIEQNEIDKGLERLKLLLEKRHQFSVFQDVAIDRLKATIASMKKEDLKNVYAKHIYQMIDEYAIYYLCKMDYTENSFDEFYFNANIFLIDFRDSLFYQEITDDYKAALKYKPLKANKIGVIIPLTGKSMDIGSLVKNGFDIAMDDYNETNKTGMTLNLIYIDEESPDLKAQVISAIDTQGIIAFMGPLYSKTVKTLIPIMDQYNTVLFSSTAGQPDLTGKSSYFFRNCGTAKGQAYSTAKYIMENTSFRNIATLYSDNAYGKILNDSFVEKIKSHGGNLVKQVVYDPKVNDFQDQMVLLGGINTILLKEKHATEKMKLDEQMESAGKKMLAKVYDYMNIIPPNDNAIPKPTPDPKIKHISICLVHLSPHGENIRRLLIDEDMTNKLSYTLAKSSASEVIKQKSVDDDMVSMGVDAEDLDRETALNIASKQGADVLIWGKIVEEKS
ncbi:MAG: penicillin-binding protein activator, partial [Candidatus Riflemargulisbacteria bacterium]